jgi:large subunit ribosomal protein L2
MTKSLRYIKTLDYSELTDKAPEKSLTVGIRSTGARNSSGRITVRFRGGGNKRSYRMIDFNRRKTIPAKVAALEYDPNRSAFIALLNYQDGEKAYILAPVGLTVGQTVCSGAAAEPKVGNALPLRNIPLGSTIHNIELVPGRGAKMVRAAGQAAVLRSKDGEYAQVKLPSGEVRLVHLNCLATIGQVGNVDHMNTAYGKAGKKRYKGFRPHVRGVAQNPIDHPMGGGEGRATGGHPKSPWGQYAKNFRTRHPKNRSNVFIVSRRSK